MVVGCKPGLSGQTRPTRPPGRKRSSQALDSFISLEDWQRRAEPSAGLTCFHVWVAKAVERQTAKENTSPQAAEVWCVAHGQCRHSGSRFKPLKAVCRRRADRCSSCEAWNLQQSKRVEVERKTNSRSTSTIWQLLSRRLNYSPRLPELQHTVEPVKTRVSHTKKTLHVRPKECSRVWLMWPGGIRQLKERRCQCPDFRNNVLCCGHS